MCLFGYITIWCHMYYIAPTWYCSAGAAEDCWFESRALHLPFFFLFICPKRLIKNNIPQVQCTIYIKLVFLANSSAQIASCPSNFLKISNLQSWREMDKLYLIPHSKTNYCNSCMYHHILCRLYGS